ncbi:hypothetical protein ABB37_04420 [Leptomonas pyrrhocoris]|uniref:Uncharacterized protein n=1 Tax=Leptomonas pyrrhocoris TaxID=157538 RepID=A0A0M9G2J4_LEPPY|nr:hypothetical protein ABB37_04420 [Leptomonas pyrrhocoris]KPA81055.1 hypothetical protein ABB37_04420 [Leptomonas pyrrhocoris]|eukprot:XP_015659494.1 hypothetical protein ABB37_04420 [Leptomonas pyrrhocoris]
MLSLALFPEFLWSHRFIWFLESISDETRLRNLQKEKKTQYEMQARGGWSSNRHPNPRQVTSKSWATAPPARDAPPEWLRRSYTRTISKHLRTVEQLRLSFEDARRQWRELCFRYKGSSVTHAKTDASCGLSLLSSGIRSSVDRLVSQLKAVKQELLAHLTHGLEALCLPSDAAAAASPSTSPQPDDFVLKEKWLQNLLSVYSKGAAAAAVADRQTDALNRDAHAVRREYLLTVWLARRVWVWSICLACATMDLELLSGSVSLSTQLYFGCPFISPNDITENLNELSCCAFDGCYNKGGEITEQDLYATAAAHVQAESSASSITAADGEAWELRTFLGFDCPTISANLTNELRADPGSHVDPQAVPAAEAARVRAAASTTNRHAPVMRDAFWVHAIALCYSIVARDDTNAARLLSAFENFYRCLRTQVADDAPDASVEEDLSGASRPHQKLYAIAFLLRVATLLLDEDYVALQRVWRREGFCDKGQGQRKAPDATTEAVADEKEDSLPSSSPAAPLSRVFPEARVLLWLISLLGEHVVRRRWTEQQLGQAFRPMEPVPHPAASRREDHDDDPSRLVYALLETEQLAANSNDGTGKADSHDDATWCTNAVRLCDTLRIAALRDMGGDWPLPGALLRAAFGGM